jgi:DNA (cytosine-5)-methyltransferase 1
MCTDCDLIVAAVQSWKRKGNLVGRYRQQYVYRCPNCSGIVEPYWVPASSIIDWDLLGQRIGDREKPLADKTRMRIAAGMARYWGPLMLQHGGHQYDAADPKHRNHGQGHGYYRVRPVTDPIPVVDTVVSKALAVPVEGREGKKAKPVEEPLRTQTARLETGLAFVAHLKGTSESQIKGAHSPVSEPLHTVAASGNHHGLVTPYYGNSHGAKSTDDPVGTITGTDRWGLVMRNNGSKGSGAEMTTPATEPIRTLTTTGHQSVVTADDIKAALEAVDEVRFRMLEPSECKRAMAFRPDYIMKGTRRSQVRLAGQAVTPPVARDLVWAVVRSLEGVK